MSVYADSETYISFQEHLESQPGAVVVLVLVDFRGHEIERQIVPLERVVIAENGKSRVKFVVDELLAAKLVPGSYKLFLYVGLPKAAALEHGGVLASTDYTLNNCLTEQGVRIVIRGSSGAPDITSVERTAPRR